MYGSALHEMDYRGKVVEVLERNGGRMLCSELIRSLKDVLSTEEASKVEFKKAVSAVAYVEHGEDQRRYLVLKEMSRDKENILRTKSVSSQATQTPKKTNKIVLSKQPESVNPTNAARQNQLPVPRRASYSTYTSNEPRQWWLASMDCRHVDMARLLGLNPKLVDWHNPIDGWAALHYAAKFGNTKCVRLLIAQSHANVNTLNRSGQTPLHVACIYSQRVVIRMLVEEFKANTCILDFSGHYPVSLLSGELRPDLEGLLTAGRLQNIRSMLGVLQTGSSRTEIHGSKDLSGQHIQSECCNGEFKRPLSSIRPIRQRETIPRPVHAALPMAMHSATLPNNYRPNLVKSSSNLGDGVVSRRTSVLINMLQTATQMASEHERTRTLSDTPSCPPSPTSVNPASPSDVQESICKSNTFSGDTGSTGSSSTNASSLSPATLLPSHWSMRYSMEQSEVLAIPPHKLPKHAPPTADPKALSLLLSLLPPSPENRTSSNKTRTQKYRHALKSIARYSSASLGPGTSSSLKRGHSRSKLSTSAIIAETDMRRLVFRSATSIGRKASTRSLNPELSATSSDDVSTRCPVGSRGPFRSYSASHSLDCTPVC